MIKYQIISNYPYRWIPEYWTGTFKIFSEARFGPRGWAEEEGKHTSEDQVEQIKENDHRSAMQGGMQDQEDSKCRMMS